MNIQHLRYAVEVEKTRSITEAAEKLFMGQPNLSRAIRELESTLGITLFDRTPKGIVPTEQGEEFLHYARSILSQFDEMTALYQKPNEEPKAFRISAARAGYISYVFSRFAKTLGTGQTLDYKETNALRAIRNVAEDGYDIGIVRYQSSYEKYFHATFREKGLGSKELWSFHYLALMSKNHPAAGKAFVTLADLADSVQISHGDTYVPSLAKRSMEMDVPAARHIYIYERGSQYELLGALDSKAFMWVSPMPPAQLAHYGLTLKPCADNVALHKDVMIFRKQQGLSPLGKDFMRSLQTACKELAKEEALLRENIPHL